MEIKGKKINFLGDSITEGGGFINIISKRTGAICRNYGVGGTRIARQTVPSDIRQYDMDFCLRAEEMNPDADIVVVFGGTNDYGHGDAPIGEPSDQTEYTFYGALNVLFTRLKQKYPSATIVVITPTRRENDESPRGEGGKKYDAATLKEYSDIIKEVAGKFGLNILDLNSYSEYNPNDGELKKKYTLDGLHPNDAGHALIADKLIEYFRNLGE